MPFSSLLYPLAPNLQPFHPRLQPLNWRLHLLHQYLHPFLRLVTRLVTKLGTKLGTSFCKTKYNCFLLNIIIRNRYSYNIIKEMSKVNGCVNLEWNIGQRNMLNSVKCFVCNLSRFVLIAKQKPTIIILLHMIGVES